MDDKYETLKTAMEINKFLIAHAGRGVQVWHYSISHSWLTLCMMHEGKVHWKNSTAEYTTINCHMVNSMILPRIGWISNLSVSEFERNESSSYGNQHGMILQDPSIGLRVDCDHIFLWVGRHPDGKYNMMPEA